jgi:hypothetical protein
MATKVSSHTKAMESILRRYEQNEYIHREDHMWIARRIMMYNARYIKHFVRLDWSFRGYFWDHEFGGYQ